ncbi:MAG: 4Fe-4S binding protein [candidate division WOR-3 bacterium]|nr:4Fe-4S binding protein [candidate division WOR-3 bacterium]
MRRISQVFFTILFNSYPGVNPGERSFMYQGSLKKVCVPILNCYSCPLAWGSCPIGSFQQTLKSGIIPFFIIGFFGIIGMLSGRFVCAWLCPFGLLQELLYKIKSIKITIPGFMRYFKYGILGLTVLIPVFWHEPFFCKFICPAGTGEASIWQILMQPMLINSIGFFFTLKYMFLIVFIAGSITMKRFFCVTLCPIGAIYGLFNRISLLKINVQKDAAKPNACTECNNCRNHCPMDIAIYRNAAHFDCIRCMKCIDVCPNGSVSSNIPYFNQGQREDASSGDISGSVSPG